MLGRPILTASLNRIRTQLPNIRISYPAEKIGSGCGPPGYLDPARKISRKTGSGSDRSENPGFGSDYKRDHDILLGPIPISNVVLQLGISEPRGRYGV